MASSPGMVLAAGAYGYGPAEMEAHLKEQNPIDRLATLAKAKVPFFVIHGDEDEVVPQKANSSILAARYHALGEKVEVIAAPNRG